MGTMNRSMNLPAVQRIMREFERESATMDMKDEMMGDAVDEAMDDDAEGIGEEEEGDQILKEVLDEIGVGLGQQVSCIGTTPTTLGKRTRGDGIDTGPDLSSSARRQSANSVLQQQHPPSGLPSEKEWARAHQRAHLGEQEQADRDQGQLEGLLVA